MFHYISIVVPGVLRTLGYCEATPLGSSGAANNTCFWDFS